MDRRRDNYLKENFNLSAEELIQNNLPIEQLIRFIKESKLGIKKFYPMPKVVADMYVQIENDNTPKEKFSYGKGYITLRCKR